MRQSTLLLACLSAAVATTSAFAAEDIGERRFGLARTGAFAGITLRAGETAAGLRVTGPRLHLSMAQLRESRLGPSAHFVPRGIELGFTKSGPPPLYFSGHRLSGLMQRLKLGGSGDSTLLIGGGLLVAAGAVLLLSGDEDRAIPSSSDCPITRLC